MIAYGSQGGPGMLLQLAILVATLAGAFLLGWLIRGLRESDCQCGAGTSTLRQRKEPGGADNARARFRTTAPSADYRLETGLHGYEADLSNNQ